MVGFKERDYKKIKKKCLSIANRGLAQTSDLYYFLFPHKNTPYHRTRGEIFVIYSDILNSARITSSEQ